MSLVGTIIAAVLVGAPIAVMAALVQRLRQHHWFIQWVIVAMTLVVAVIVVAALVQPLHGRWRSDCSGGSVGAAITTAAALMQRLRRQ